MERNIPNQKKQGRGQNSKKGNYSTKKSLKSFQKSSKEQSNRNRFGSFINNGSDEDVATSDNTSSISDFSFGTEKWNLEKISDVFSRLRKKTNAKRISKIVEKGLHTIVYEAPDQPDLIINFVTNSLKQVNLEKGILDTIKRLRILEETNAKCDELLSTLLNKLKVLSQAKTGEKGIHFKKKKTIEEREESIISFISYYIFKMNSMTKDDYVSIYNTLEWNQINYFKSKLSEFHHNFKLHYITQFFIIT